jgi:hypothetical protein
MGSEQKMQAGKQHKLLSILNQEPLWRLKSHSGWGICVPGERFVACWKE